MNILHTEASLGWGGQEMRILSEAIGMRERGHQVYFAVAKGAKLALRARTEGFTVYEIPLEKPALLRPLRQLRKLIRELKIDLINTHSSWDSWVGGIAARLMGIKALRTRHLSAPIHPGLNAKLLYHKLTDYVVTTSTVAADMVVNRSSLPTEKCRCIATGVNPADLTVSQDQIAAFREKYDVGPEDFLAGTLCVVRSWKGVLDLIRAADFLRNHDDLKWIIAGGGYLDGPKKLVHELSLDHKVFFTDHLEKPAEAVAAFDLFLLLSTANEGISQASLQAAYLEKPLITTTIGGLPEVCLEAKTGFLVPPHAPEQVAERVLRLKENPLLREEMGHAGKKLVENQFTREKMLDEMEEVYSLL